MAERKVVKIHTKLLGGSLEPVLLDRLERPCGDADADKLVALLPPQLARLQVDLLCPVRVGIRLGHVHGLAVLASARQVALPFPHHEAAQTARCLKEFGERAGGEVCELWATFLTGVILSIHGSLINTWPGAPGFSSQGNAERETPAPALDFANV